MIKRWQRCERGRLSHVWRNVDASHPIASSEYPFPWYGFRNEIGFSQDINHGWMVEECLFGASEKKICLHFPRRRRFLGRCSACIFFRRDRKFIQNIALLSQEAASIECHYNIGRVSVMRALLGRVLLTLLHSSRVRRWMWKWNEIFCFDTAQWSRCSRWLRYDDAKATTSRNKCEWVYRMLLVHASTRAAS